MRTITLSILLTISALFTTNLSADETTILVNRVGIDTRSTASFPQVTISDSNILAITFDESDIFHINIEDYYGEIVYTSVFYADGQVYTYDLSSIGQGTFKLTLDGLYKFEGYFHTF